MPRRVRVRVYSNEIQGLFLPTGQLGREMRSFGVEARNLAKTKSLAFKGPQARKRPQARIKDSHAIEGPVVRRFGVSVDVVNTSPHALYKHEGVMGRIFPQGKYISFGEGKSFMQIPRGPWGPRKVESVRGQVGKPWVREAVEETILRRYGV